MIIQGGGHPGASAAVERRAADVAVVGDSAAAFATAYSLTKRGKRVALVAPPPSQTSRPRKPPPPLASVPFKAPCACPVRTALAVEAAAYWRGIERAAADARLLVPAPSLDVFCNAASGDGGGRGDLTAAACRAAGLRAALLRPEEITARLPGNRFRGGAAAVGEGVFAPDGGGVLLLRSAREALAELAGRAITSGGGGGSSGSGGGGGGPPVLEGWRERQGGSFFELRCRSIREPDKVLFVEAESVVVVVEGGRKRGRRRAEESNNGGGHHRLLLADAFGLDLGSGLTFGQGTVGRWRAGDGTDAASGQLPVWEAFWGGEGGDGGGNGDASAAAAVGLWGMPAPVAGGTVAVGSGVVTGGQEEDGKDKDDDDDDDNDQDEEERRAASSAARSADQRLRQDVRARANSLFRGLVDERRAGGGASFSSPFASSSQGRLRGGALLLADEEQDGAADDADDDGSDDEGGGGNNKRHGSKSSWMRLSGVPLLPGAPGAVGFHPGFEAGRFVVVVEAASSMSTSSGGGGGGCMAFGGGAQMAPLLAGRAAELVFAGGGMMAEDDPLALCRPGLEPRALVEVLQQTWEGGGGGVGGGATAMAAAAAARRERREEAAERREEKRRAKAD
jgi:hypothetical protein